MTTRIICWSGGPDSTYLLKKALEESSDPVVAVCDIGDHLNRAGIQVTRGAIRRLSHGLQQIRRFKTVEVAVNITPEPEAIGRDQSHAFAVMMVANQYPDAEVWWGRNAWDKEPQPDFDINEVKNPESVAETERLIRLICPLHKTGYDVSKAQIVEELGWMWHETISCEDLARTKEPCKDCGKCKERAAAERAAIENASKRGQ